MPSKKRPSSSSQQTLMKFFRTSADPATNDENDGSRDSADVPLEFVNSNNSEQDVIEDSNVVHSEEASRGTAVSATDIGLFSDGKTRIDDVMKLRLLKECWKPDQNYSFIRDKYGRSFQLKWF